MAFLRFSRDKRGYELFTLVQPDQQRGGQSRPRVLYAFRTPPNIRVGREPFDDETRRTLEQAYPGVGFNWRQIKETPIPAADAIDWRERRRAIKEAKQAAKREQEQEQQEEAQKKSAEPAEAAAQGAQPAAAGETPSARRRRRRRGRGRRPEAGVVPTPTAGEGGGASEGGSGIPETPETAAEPDPSS